MRKIVLTYGLIAGGILSGMMLLTLPFLDRIGFDKGAVIGYTTMVLAFLLVFFGVKAYRDSVAAEELTFGRALTVGLLIMAVGTVCYVATWQFVYHVLAPDFPEKYAAHVVEKARQAGASAAALAERTRQMAEFTAMYKNPLVNIAFTFLEPLPVGLIFAFVTAGILGRKRRAKAVATP